MAQKREEHPLLQRPLYVFDLPPELLQTFTFKSQSGSAPHDLAQDPTTAKQVTQSEVPESQDGGPTKATSCNLCGLSFANVQEQRGHIRSDLHGYNLKQKMKGLPPIGETEFEKLVVDLDESISGSESSDSSTDEEGGGASKEGTLAALLKKQAKIVDPHMEGEIQTKRRRGAGKAPLLWFGSALLPPEISLGVYRTIFTDAEQEEETYLVETIKKKQLKPSGPSRKHADGGGVPLPLSSAGVGPHYFLCMIGGGHFAAMVVALTPKITKNSGMEERQATVVAHKTFHRYTTRRKQGGAQSANDAAKGNAHSAGASLRRHNEVALMNEVRELLGQWKDLISSADLLFIRATSSTNRRTLFGPYEGQVLRQNDPRIRGFPFSTRRATQSELMRSFVELTRVKVSRLDEASLAAASQTSQSSSKPTAPTPSKSGKSSKPTVSPEEENLLLHTTQLTSLIRRSKAPGLLSYLTSNNLSSNFHFFPEDAPQHHHTPTPLHLAASIGSSAVVLALLTKAQADPGVVNAEGKPAFALAGDRGTRDTFRVARSILGEKAWDWDAAGVPPAMTKFDAEAREKRERAEAEAAEAARRKTETERLRVESREKEEGERDKRIGKGKVLAGSAVTLEKSAAEKREEEARGMTPEMRMRLERERRARAAEERMRRM